MARRLSEAVPRAVLDSNVIFSRVLHELLGRVAASLRLLDVIWSDELLAESERADLRGKGPPAIGTLGRRAAYRAGRAALR